MIPAAAEPLHIAPGRDPGGAAIALLTTPFELTNTQLEQKLARDGEGVAIGWDFSKRPKRSDTGGPQAAGYNPPDIANILARSANMRLVLSFIDPLRPATWAQAVSFVARTPARIVVIPYSSANEAEWATFRAAAEHFPDLLFVVPVSLPNGAHPGALSYPAAFHLSNVLSVAISAGSKGDVAVVGQQGALSSEQALALTAKTLLSCQGDQNATENLSKLDALALLQNLAPQSDQSAQKQITFKPCAAALN